MMNPNLTLDDLQWQTLIQQTAGYFSDLTIKRGFQYYKQGRVHASEKADASGVIEASVDGTETYRIRLQLHSLSDSECSCPVNEGCKHMVAVLLDYAQLQGRSIHALVNAHSTTYAATSSYDRSEPGLSQGHERPPAGVSKWRVKADHLPELPISAWHELFEVCTASLGANTQNSFYAKNALASLHHIKPPLPPDMDPLYELHAHLFILEKLVKQPASAWNASGSYIGYHTQVAADHILARIERILHEGLEDSEPEEAFGQRLTETISFVRRSMLSEPRNRKFYAQVYMQLWMHWIHPLAKERRLDQGGIGAAAGSRIGTRQQPFACLMVYGAELNVLLSRRRRIVLGPDQGSGQGEQPAPGFRPGLLRHAAFGTRLGPLGPLASGDRPAARQSPERAPQQLSILLGCRHRAPARGSGTDVEQSCRHAPYSKDIYQNALITHGRWREWIDYQLSTGREPLELRVSELAPIEKNAPELLLPLPSGRRTLYPS